MGPWRENEEAVSAWKKSGKKSSPNFRMQVEGLNLTSVPVQESIVRKS